MIEGGRTLALVPAGTNGWRGGTIHIYYYNIPPHTGNGYPIKHTRDRRCRRRILRRHYRLIRLHTLNYSWKRRLSGLLPYNIKYDTRTRRSLPEKKKKTNKKHGGWERGKEGEINFWTAASHRRRLSASRHRQDDSVVSVSLRNILCYYDIF